MVSTATKALQEQIFLKDIPLVKEVLARHGLTPIATIARWDAPAHASAAE